MPNTPDRQPKRKRHFLAIFKFMLGMFVFSLLAIAALLGYLYQTNLPVADTDRNSRLLDSQGNIIASFSASGRSYEPVPLDQISPQLIEATLAVEDRKFYDHIGFDIWGMGRALLVNLEHMDRSQGASTLTQQLARNLYLSHEKTWSRKLKEAMYTAQLEMKYSKHDILQMYLNEIYYGHGAYGIEAASQMYFGKSAKQLDLAESALLAGIPKGPTYYSPFNHMDNAKSRQQIVLSSMAEVGDITQTEAREAADKALNFKLQSESKVTVNAPYFRDYIRNLVTNQLGISEDQLDHGGLNIYTTLDSHAQQAAEDAVAKGMDPTSDLDTALISMDPRTGYIKAMVGGKNYQVNQYNHTLAKTRQPGSSFKPIMYLTALSTKAMTGLSTFNSEPTLFHYDNNRKTYQPSNFGEKYLGEINMQEAIAASDNIYAVNTLMKVGADKVIDMARKLGIVSPLQSVPSLALGTSPISPFEMASAFSVIGNGGKRMQPLAVLKITDAAGGNIFQAEQESEEQVVDPAAAYVLTHLMESVFETGGTGNRVSSLMKRPVAGKTGTTNTDAWLVGFTPELATAVWVGYDKGREITTTDGHRAAPIFAQYTENALSNVPPKIFTIPSGVVSVYIDQQTGKLATANCPEKKLEVFIQGTEPTEYCTIHGADLKDPATPSGNTEDKRGWWSDFKRWITD
ncbi:transglycosylase domain-containing protein [Paenibacillus pini]|uniref:Multimodular transpeptidase-transglycosylase n=1 Tax=Paenibacillus pini JCM 16418 TaxID=1236976 RepID=W7Z0H0_9BACL|nr:PBP1A family penicillin-binding protein [Paenibacillus pini]GAF10451.1 multimodular transpeptidase-transglycosylase [Paenibacillus pini JCM 16418]